MQRKSKCKKKKHKHFFIKTSKGEEDNKGLILPLYFGWQIRIILEKVADLKKHIVGPFKKYWQYMTVVVFLIFLTSTFLILNNNSKTNAATYYFTQTDWSGGASTTDIAVHDTDNTGWTYYHSADDYVDFSTDGEISIQVVNQAQTQTLSADFVNGSGIGVSTSSDRISLDL